MFDIPPSTPQYACGSCGDSAFTQSNTCSERQAHAATKAELAEARRAEAEAIRALAEYRERLATMTEIAEELGELLDYCRDLKLNPPTERAAVAALSRLYAARKEAKP